jgi:hypothetical protein
MGALVSDDEFGRSSMFPPTLFSAFGMRASGLAYPKLFALGKTLAFAPNVGRTISGDGGAA